MENYEEAWKEWRSNPDAYYEKMAEKLHWYKKWNRIWEMDGEKKIKWFVGGETNLCYNCLDKHINEGFGDQTILIHESHYTKEVKLITYNFLLQQVERLAGFLTMIGIKEGDYVLINLPMIPETIIAILAAVRIGAPYLVVTQGHMHFLPEFIMDFKPKVIFSTNFAFIEKETVPVKSKLDEVLQNTKYQPSKCIIVQRSYFESAKMHVNRDISWSDAIKNGFACDCIPIEATKPLFVIFTSGSTGKPKGIIHAVGSFSVGLVNDGVKTWHCCDGGVFWGLTQFAWIGGHCAVTFGSLLTRTKSILYEGPSSDPNIDDIYRIMSNYGVTNVFFTVPLIRSIRSKDLNGDIAKTYGGFQLKNMVSGGAAINQVLVDYVQKVFKAPLLQLYGQTELNGPITTYELFDGCLTKCRALLSSGKPFPGWEMKIFKDDKKEAAVGEPGTIAFKLPLGPGVMSTFFHDENLFHNMYLTRFPGYYETKDEGYIDENGYLFVTSRTDSVFKLKGDRLSCDQIEQVLLSHENISECVVPLINIKISSYDEYCMPVGFYVLCEGQKSSTEEINNSIQELLLRAFGANILDMELFSVKCIPKTEAGKLSRSAIQKIIHDALLSVETLHLDGGMLHIYDAFCKGKTYKTLTALKNG